jgi:hypothetical protein
MVEAERFFWFSVANMAVGSMSLRGVVGTVRDNALWQQLEHASNVDWWTALVATGSSPLAAPPPSLCV